MEIDDVVQVPKETKTTLIFPWSTSDKKFERKKYEPTQTNGKASKEEVDDFLSIMDQIVNEKSEADLFDAAVNLLKWGIPLGAIMCMIEGSLSPEISSLVMLAFFSVISWQIAGFLQKKKKKSKSEKIKQSLIKALKEKSLEERFKSFGKKKLRWKIPQYFPKWIELHKDYEKPDEPETTADQKDKAPKEEPKK